MATKNNPQKDLAYYLNLPWTYSIEPTTEKGNKFYIIKVNEIPGVITDAPTVPEAMNAINEALTLALEVMLKHGDEIPEPFHETQFAGNISYRTTSARHYLIARIARKHNLSLSQVIDSCIDMCQESAKFKTSKT